MHCSKRSAQNVLAVGIRIVPLAALSPPPRIIFDGHTATNNELHLDWCY
jgi:hypothetical protein